MTIKCTGATTAVISWLPDLSVVPTAKFTLQYKTKESRTFTNMSFLDAAAQNLIYVMHVNNLNPSSEYVFAIASENYLGIKRSNEVKCITSGIYCNYKCKIKHLLAINMVWPASMCDIYIFLYYTHVLAMNFVWPAWIYMHIMHTT